MTFSHLQWMCIGGVDNSHLFIFLRPPAAHYRILKLLRYIEYLNSENFISTSQEIILQIFIDGLLVKADHEL